MAQEIAVRVDERRHIRGAAAALDAEVVVETVVENFAAHAEAAVQIRVPLSEV